MAIDVKTERVWLLSRFRAFGKPGGDKKMQDYMGSPYPIMGLSTPQMRELHKEFKSRNQSLTVAEVNALAKEMWSGKTFEEKSFAIGLLGRNRKILNTISWKLMDGFVDEAIGWALSDGLAAGPIGTFVQSHPDRFKELLKWTKSKHFWRRRASTYALNDYIRLGELDRPFELLEKLLYDKEFWVQRAVGTWLRECWKKDQKKTEAFLRKHVKGLPPVTITVATERSSKNFREELRRKSKKKS